VSRIDFLGHATAVIRIGAATLVTDPLLRRRVSGLVHRHPHAFSVMPSVIDGVLISHLHHDHLDIPSLRRLGPDTLVVVPRHGGALLRRQGFGDVVELQPGQWVDIGGLRIRATRAVHLGLRAPWGPLGGCLGFVIETPGKQVYFAGDTQAFPEMRTFGPIDVALVPIAGWGPVLGPGHMGPRAAVEALRLLQPRIVIPIHWGSLVPFGLHRRTWSYLTRPPLEFVELSGRETPEVHVEVLQPGQSLAF